MKETFKYKDEEYKAEITCQSATVLIGMDRDLMIAEGYDNLEKENKIDGRNWASLRVLLLSLWPSCKAGSASVDIKKKKMVGEKIQWEKVSLTYNNFINFPEALTNKWLSVIFRLNPHWAPGYEESESEEDKEKKA